MARFVNINPGSRYILRHNRDQRLTDGSSIRVEEGLYADFQPLMFTEWEKDAAYERFGNQIYKGRRMNDEAGMLGTIPMSQDWRIGVFDTNWLPSEDREEAEKRLMEHKALGNTFIRVDKPKIPRPFPTWDSIDSDQLLDYVENLGLDPVLCINYEKDNQNRTEIIEALEDLATVETEEVIQVNA